MKKPIKKCFAILLVITLTLTAAPLSGFVGLGEELFTVASAATSGDYTYRVLSDGTAEITGYTGDGGDVVIPDSIDGYTVTSIGDEAFRNCDDLTAINIPNSVTTIGDRAFYSCAALTTIDIPDSVTTIGDYAFTICYDLTTVTIGNSVTAIGTYAFEDCHALTTIEIPDSVITIGDDAFRYCNALTTITVAEENPKYSSDAYGVLFDKAKTTLIQYPIGNSRTEYTIPDSVATIGDEAFSFCLALTTVEIPNSVTTIGDEAFATCSALTTIDIPDSVTTIGDGAFSSCAALTTIDIPDSVTTIGDGAFSFCYALTTIDIPDSVTTIGGSAFATCSALTTITVAEENPKYSSDAYGVLFDKAKTTLIRYPIGNSRTEYIIPDNVTTIGDDAFYGCDALTAVDIGNSVTTIGDDAFYGCDALIAVDIGNSVSAIGDSVFGRCDALTTITVADENPNYSSDAYGVLFDKNKTTLIQYPIGNRRTEYIIPDSVTTAGYSAFRDCDALTTIEIPHSVTTVGDLAFYGCDALSTVCYTGTEEQWNAINIGLYNDSLANAEILFNSHMDTGNPDDPVTPEIVNQLLRFDENIILLDIGETKQLTVYHYDSGIVDGEVVYFNRTQMAPEQVYWNVFQYEENGLFSVTEDGRITGLTEGLGYVSVTEKENINSIGSCWVYVGEPQEFQFLSKYDSQQYYADGGFYSDLSSISDCVELYFQFSNQLVKELAQYSDSQNPPVDEQTKAQLKTIAPITLTAQIDGTGLSFSRESNQQTYTATYQELAVDHTVDDLLMLFPQNLTVPPEGKTYTVTVTLSSESFDPVTEKYTFTVENLETKSANEHIEFILGNLDYKVSKRNTYGYSMAQLKNDSEYVWSKYSTLDFENYYEVIFADILIGIMQTPQFSNVSLMPVIKEWVGNYNEILDNLDTIVTDDYTGYLDVTDSLIDKVLKKSKYTTDGMNVDDELRDFVLIKLRDKVSIDKINRAFAAIDKTGQILSVIELGGDVVNDLISCVNGVAVLNSYQKMDDAFKKALEDLYNLIPDSDKKIKEAVGHYANTDTTFGYTVEVLDEIRDMAQSISIDVFKKVYMKKTIASFIELVGKLPLKSGALLSSTAAFSAITTGVGAITTGAQIGLCISDILCDNSGKAEKMGKTIAASEFVPYVLDLLNDYEAALISQRNDTAVSRFEQAFSLHKTTQKYILKYTIESLEAKRDSIIIKLFGTDDYDGLIADILVDKNTIENMVCHSTSSGESIVRKYKTIIIKCPVDIVLLDSKGSEAVSIKDENIEYVAQGIEVFVDDQKKYIAVPADELYSVEISATGEGFYL